MSLFSTRVGAGALILAGFIVGLGADAASARALRPVQRCQIAKLSAAGAELRMRLLCDLGRGGALGETPCSRAAAARRTAAFARAERGAQCPVLGDEVRIGTAVTSSRSAILIVPVPADDPAAKRCAARQLTLAAREVWDRVRADVTHERTGDDARLLSALARQQARFDAAYARLARSHDCAAQPIVPASYFLGAIVDSVNRLRRDACPSCGAVCPCWSTEELDTGLSPATLRALGGAVCDEGVTGVVSRDRCTAPEGWPEQPRTGVSLAGGLCVWWVGDADPDGDGTCNASPLVASLDDFEQAACLASLEAAHVRQVSCAPASGPRRVEPLPVPSGGFPLGVGGREWIAVWDRADVVLPWDASGGAGPLPVPGCPLGSDGACRVPMATAAVGDTDWRVGQRSAASGGVEFFALGPQGEVVALPTREGDVLRFVRVGAGPLFHGDVERGGRFVPVVWTAPDAPYRELPVGDFARAPSPLQSDASRRIVGDAEEARMPVLWTPSGDGYRLETLPLLDGDTTGSASSIDADVVAGISGSRAVAWEITGDRVRVVELPKPREAVRCTGSAATSRGRVLGVCEWLDGRMVGVVWVRPADAPDGWRAANVLTPFAGDDGALFDGFRGDLVVGRSVFFVQTGGLATSAVWRLPSPSS